MSFAPIWTMSPTTHASLYSPPLRFLSPNRSGLLDKRSRVFGSRDYRNGKPLDKAMRPGGLWFDSGTEAYPADRLEAEIIKHKALELNGFVFLTSESADALRGLDFGDGKLSELPVYREDMSTSFDFTVFLLEFPNAKDTVDRNATPKVRPVFPDDPLSGFELPQILEENDVFVHKSAVGGPDLWFDPCIKHVQFCSDACANALSTAGLKSKFGLNQCKFFNA